MTKRGPVNPLQGSFQSTPGFLPVVSTPSFQRLCARPTTCREGKEDVYRKVISASPYCRCRARSRDLFPDDLHCSCCRTLRIALRGSEPTRGLHRNQSGPNIAGGMEEGPQSRSEELIFQAFLIAPHASRTLLLAASVCCGSVTIL